MAELLDFHNERREEALWTLVIIVKITGSDG